MLESRGATRKVEVACIVIALVIWVAGIAFGVQTMLGPRSRAMESTPPPSTVHYYGYEEEYDGDGYQPASAQPDRQARADSSNAARP